MALYRLFLFRHGEIAGKIDRHSADDADILETAQALCRRAYTVEIYQENRFVARLQECEKRTPLMPLPSCADCS